MRLLSSSTALLVLGLAGYAASVGFKASPADGKLEGVAKTLNGVFHRTQNLRGGDGKRCVGRQRRPGVPFFFHAEKPVLREAPTGLSFALDEELGVYVLETGGDLDDSTVPFGSLYFADASKKRPVGHLVMSTSGPGFPSWTKIDAQRLAGTYKGISYKSGETIAADGKGFLQATGTHPIHGRYTMKGTWSAANAGTWSQSWVLPGGAWEKDAYQTKADGTSVLKVKTSEGLDLTLAFSHDLSGQGTISGARQGKIAWDLDGDGTIKWSDGETMAFEDWKL